MTKNTREEIFERLRENSDDDALWAAYGEVLRDQSDVRGEAIGLELAIRPHTEVTVSGSTIMGGGSKIDKLRAKLEKINKRLEKEIPSGLAQEMELGNILPGWRFGFLHSITFFEKATFRQSPYSALEYLSDDADYPFFSELDFQAEEPSCVRSLLGIEFLEKLKSLKITCYDLGLKEAQAVADSRSLRNLVSLRLNGGRIKTKGVQALAKSSFLNKLTSLSLGHCETGINGIRAVAKSPSLENLRRLDLSGCSLKPNAVMALAQTKSMTQLVELDLSRNEIGDDGARAIAESSSFSHLRKLELEDCLLTDAGAMAIMKSTFFENLVRLDLHQNDISDDAIEAIKASAEPKLRWLGYSPGRLSSSPSREEQIYTSLSKQQKSELKRLIEAQQFSKAALIWRKATDEPLKECLAIVQRLELRLE